MPILTECEWCGKRYRLGDDKAGAVLPCRECGEDFQVPGPKRSGRKRGGRKSSRGRGNNRRQGLEKKKLLQIGGAAGVGLLLLIIVGFMLSGGGLANWSPGSMSGSLQEEESLGPYAIRIPIGFQRNGPVTSSSIDDIWHGPQGSVATIHMRTRTDSNYDGLKRPDVRFTNGGGGTYIGGKAPMILVDKGEATYGMIDGLEFTQIRYNIPAFQPRSSSDMRPRKGQYQCDFYAFDGPVYINIKLNCNQPFESEQFKSMIAAAMSFRKTGDGPRTPPSPETSRVP